MSEREMTGNILFLSKSAGDCSERTNPAVQLVERITNGDQSAFNEFYRMFSPMVHGIILARVPRDEVEDIVQEVFLLAYRKLNTLRESYAVGAWLAMIARNSAAEFYRSKKQTEELPEDVRHYDRPYAEANEILDAIRSLPDAYRETLVLRLVEGMSGKEISQQTGLTELSVRGNLHRGMKLLKQKLRIED